MNTRLLCTLAMLVAVGAGVGGQIRSSANSDQTTLRAPSTDFEVRVESLVHNWFLVIENPTVEAAILDDLLAAGPFELVLDGEMLRDRHALLEWVSDLRATYPQIEYRIDPIRIHTEGRGLYRIQFEFDRHAIDEAGLRHVARREHTWIVRSDGSTTPVILSIAERPLLFFPGTGPQIVCY